MTERIITIQASEIKIEYLVAGQAAHIGVYHTELQNALQDGYRINKVLHYNQAIPLSASVITLSLKKRS
ncbi:hypothetical protein QNI19_21510 [Cytophagaceae bacterium DM2B3-1]|uniref:Uncharacterized protein n=1 Tax=Xanthocytophaga flava TaxID=3048013 RepID=A0AAE3QGL0_9BACT|nr:hypothetical protein [Xanthocytophaga flavus]MDJ1478992.1 hypothetical protein [Xanthocytophaga flavus]MDJ1495532.1 hypothetical protein [Xanthocytophaga flavus]